MQKNLPMVGACFNCYLGRISVFSLTQAYDIFDLRAGCRITFQKKSSKDMFMGAGSINIMIGNIFNHVVKPMSFGI